MPYRSATIYYLTGTGNSRRVATWFADAAVERGLDVRLGSMESARPEEELQCSPGHLLGLLLPAHGFTAPWSMVRFAARMPWGRGMHAFVAATRGGTKIGPCRFPGMEGTTVYLIGLLLILRGYSFRGGRGIDMPSNWTALHSGMVAVGTAIADRPPHRSVRALLRHTAPTSDVWRRSVRRDKDAPAGDEEASGRTTAPRGPRSDGLAGCAAPARAASIGRSAHPIAAGSPSYPARRGIGRNRSAPA
jgi:hypothetical protein